MAEYLNTYHLTHFAGIVADALGIELPEEFAPTIGWVSDVLRSRLNGHADRAVLYHADAVGQYIWQKYTSYFAPVYANTNLALPYTSTVESVTPVAHASMYTGLEPEGHGIQTYVRPKLECVTLFDVLIKLGLKPCILAQQDSTFLHIFAGRDMDYYEEPCAAAIQEKAQELLMQDQYDVISIHTFDYDNAAHHYGPESKEGLNAIALEAQGFADICDTVRKTRPERKTLVAYAPDHGQHQIAGGHGAHGSKMTEDMNILHFYGII